MKTVLLVVPSLGIGGQEKIAINTVHCLKDEYNVKLVVFQSREVEYEAPCEIINLNIPSKKNVLSKLLNQVKRIFCLKRLRKKYNADIVLSFGNTANITNVFSGVFSCGKSISAIHGFAEVKKSLSMRAILSLSSNVICIAKSMQESLLKLYPKANNTVVIENGYDIETVLLKSKENLDVELPHPTLVSMGRLENVKGFDRLIKAFAIAHNECQNWNLLLVGQGSLEEKLKSLAEDEGVTDFVYFTGYQSNPYVYLKKSDIYVLSSRNEGFPNCLIEALCCELPIIAMDCMSGPREILSERYSSERTVGIIQEKYGLLVEESSSEDEIIQNLARAMVLLINNTELIKKYRESGVGRANQFNNDVYREKIISLIERGKVV